MTEEHPEPPTNVRVVRAGIEYPCEVEYRGVLDGSHIWEVVDEHCDIEAGDSFRIGKLPAHTSLSWSVRPKGL